MDTLRGTFDNGNPADDSSDWANGSPDTGTEDETVRELPPEAIGQDERRMQVRAYNHWASMLGEATSPRSRISNRTTWTISGPIACCSTFPPGSTIQWSNFWAIASLKNAVQCKPANRSGASLMCRRALC